MSQHEVVLLLGSNLANPEKNLEIAMENIESKNCKIIKKSRIIKTPPIEFVSSNNFRNIALLIKTPFSPIKLLNFLKNIEQLMGRKEDSYEIGEYIDRIIDIDIVLYDNICFYSKKLEIPHEKHLLQRSFSKILMNELKDKS